MKNINFLKSIMLLNICNLLIIANIYSQNITIDYEAWNQADNCDIFTYVTNVPATINGVNSIIQHQTLLGDTKYSSTDKSLQLDNQYVNSADTKGSKFRIAYNFKVGYRYTIFVTSAAMYSNSNSNYAPYLRLDLSNNNSGGGVTCTGAQAIVPNIAGNPTAIPFVNVTFSDVQFVFSPALTSSFSALEVSGIPPLNPATNSIRIRKIVITETPPPVTFTLPTSQSITCGLTVPVTCTVTNVYNSPGVTGYT